MLEVYDARVQVVDDVAREEHRRDREGCDHYFPMLVDAPVLNQQEADDQQDGRCAVEKSVDRRERVVKGHAGSLSRRAASFAMRSAGSPCAMP